MDREKSLAKNTIIITIGRVCTQLITFFLLPLYTGVLSTEEYGTIDFINTIVTLMLPIVAFQVEQAIFRELIEVRNKKEKIIEILTTGVITVTFQCLIFSIIFLLISPIINNIYKYYLGLNVITYIFFSLYQQIARGLGKNKEYAIASFITAITTIILNIVFLLIVELGAKGMLLGIILGQLSGIVYLFLSLKMYTSIKPRTYSKEIIKKLWKYSIPLIPNALSWWVFNASDRVIVTALLGVDQNGILAASLKFSSVYIVLYNIFNISWTESISMAIDDKDIDDYFNKMFNIVLNLFSAMGIGMIACMPFVYPIMINKNYAFGYNLVPISIIAAFFHIIVGLISVIYVAKKNTKAIANTSIVSAIINIVVHLILIKFTGLYAAVVSTFSAFFIMSTYRVVHINKHYFKIKFKIKSIIKSIITLGVVIYLYYINNVYLNLLSLLLAIIFAIDINKNSIHFILNLIRRKTKKKELINE